MVRLNRFIHILIIHPIRLWTNQVLTNETGSDWSIGKIHFGYLNLSKMINATTLVLHRY